MGRDVMAQLKCVPFWSAFMSSPPHPLHVSPGAVVRVGKAMEHEGMERVG